MFDKARTVYFWAPFFFHSFFTAHSWVVLLILCLSIACLAPSLSFVNISIVNGPFSLPPASLLWRKCVHHAKAFSLIAFHLMAFTATRDPAPSLIWFASLWRMPILFILLQIIVVVFLVVPYISLMSPTTAWIPSPAECIDKQINTWNCLHGLASLSPLSINYQQLCAAFVPLQLAHYFVDVSEQLLLAYCRLCWMN